MPPFMAAAITAAEIRESSLNPLDVGAAGEIGKFQLLPGERLNKYRQWATAEGKNPWTGDTQNEYLMHLMQIKDPDIVPFMQATNLTEAVAGFTGAFERPKLLGPATRTDFEMAQQLLKEEGATFSTIPQKTDTGDSSAISGPSDVGTSFDNLTSRLRDLHSELGTFDDHLSNINHNFGGMRSNYPLPTGHFKQDTLVGSP
jgi:hypothetical protein